MAKMTWTKKGDEPLDVTNIVIISDATGDGSIAIYGDIEHIIPDRVRLTLTRQNIRAIIAMAAPMNLNEYGDSYDERMARVAAARDKING